MVLENKGEEFTMKYSAKNFTIPTGKFEVTDALGNHLMSRIKNWGKDIVVISGPKEENAVNEIIPETIVEEDPAEEVPEEAPVEEDPAEEDKKKKKK